MQIGDVCKRDHAITSETLYVASDGRTGCRTCRRMASRSPLTIRRKKAPKVVHLAVNGYLYQGQRLIHRDVATAALGRPLPRSACVHHVDGDPTNNAPTNLVVCQDLQYHNLLHRRLEAYRATGNANALRCCKCHRHDSPSNLVQRTIGRRGVFRAYHRKCPQITKRGLALVAEARP